MPDVIVNFEGERGNHARGYFVVSDLDETQRCWNVRLASQSLPFFLLFSPNFLREMVNLPWGYSALCSVKYKRLAKHFLKAARTSSYQSRTESGYDKKTCLCSFNVIQIFRFFFFQSKLKSKVQIDLRTWNCIVWFYLTCFKSTHQHVLLHSDCEYILLWTVSF